MRSTTSCCSAPSSSTVLSARRPQAMSSAITTTRGIVMRLPVPGRSPLKVFWTTHGDDGNPRIEAVLDHPAG